MTEREPILPYNTVHFYKWCEENGVDDRHYSLDKLLVAKLRSPELSKELKLRAEIEASLPLQGSQLVEDPRIAAESWGSQPKVFLAPEGMAYQLEARIDFNDGDEDIDGNKLPPTSSETYTMVGEYLAVETRTVSGKTVGFITVRKRPSKYAVPTLHDGNPDEGGVIRLPSRADPEKDGAYVAFSRLEGWEVGRSPSQKLEGDYGKSKVELVPYEREDDTSFYVADFGRYNDFKLDDFIFVDEQPVLPPGYFMMPSRGAGGDLDWTPVYNPASLLILPPIDRKHWDSLWNHHGIMIKLNPTVHNFLWGDSRFLYLDFDETHSVDFEMRRFNTHEHKDKTLMRAIAVRGIGSTTLEDVIKVASSKDQFEGEDREKFG